MTDTFLILAILLAGAAVVLAYIPRPEAGIAAFGALLCGSFSNAAPVQGNTLWFWGAAAAIALGIQMMLPKAVVKSRLGVAFFATGALAGSMVGLTMHSPAAVICASAVGVFLGAVAVSRLNSGKSLDFPSTAFFNYLLAKGLPMVVTFSTLGILFLSLRPTVSP